MNLVPRMEISLYKIGSASIFIKAKII